MSSFARNDKVKNPSWNKNDFLDRFSLQELSNTWVRLCRCFRAALVNVVLHFNGVSQLAIDLQSPHEIKRAISRQACGQTVCCPSSL